jgi:aminopeptidase 2
MLYDYIGEAQFFKGVSLYLKKHLFGSTVTQDLWEGMTSATGLDITHLMENWIKKIGYPVLTITERDKDTLFIRQDRFLDTGPASPEHNETIWYDNPMTSFNHTYCF